MVRAMVDDLDYLAARIHGQRSRLAEASRLENLCRLPDYSELSRAVYPDAEFHALADFQRHLAQALVRELSSFLRHLEGPAADLLGWILARFQVENIKVLVRAFVHRTPLETPEEYLLSLPHDLALDVEALLAAGSLQDFTELLPLGAPRQSLRQAMEIYHDQPPPFFLEAALDRGYFQALLAALERLSEADQELIKPILLQEVDVFHLMLVVRGRFHHGLTPEQLLPLHVRGSGIPNERFKAMLAATEVLTSASLAVGRAIDALPSASGSSEAAAGVDLPALEALAWRRYLRLSNRAVRCSHMGLGAVMGYVGIRRVEVANLITLSEAIRSGTAAERIRARLIPRADLESVYVYAAASWLAWRSLRCRMKTVSLENNETRWKGEHDMKIQRVDTWVAPLKDKPGNLAARLEALADAGVSLEFVLARRAPDKPGTGVVFVTPITGAAQCRAAEQAGFRKATSLHALRIEGMDKKGEGGRMARALAEHGLNLRGLSAATIGKKFVAHIALDTPAEVAKAARVLRVL